MLVLTLFPIHTETYAGNSCMQVIIAISVWSLWTTKKYSLYSLIPYPWTHMSSWLSNQGSLLVCRCSDYKPVQSVHWQLMAGSAIQTQTRLLNTRLLAALISELRQNVTQVELVYWWQQHFTKRKIVAATISLPVKMLVAQTLTSGWGCRCEENTNVPGARASLIRPWPSHKLMATCTFDWFEGVVRRKDRVYPKFDFI